MSDVRRLPELDTEIGAGVGAELLFFLLPLLPVTGTEGFLWLLDLLDVGSALLGAFFFLRLPLRATAPLPPLAHSGFCSVE